MFDNLKVYWWCLHFSVTISVVINEILIPRQKTIETGQKAKNFFKPTIWFHFFPMTFRDNCLPLPQMENQRRKKETDHVRYRKTNHGNGLVPNGTGHGKKVKPNRRFKKNFFVFCPVSIVFCRGIRISLIMIFTGEDYEKLNLCSAHPEPFCHLFSVQKACVPLPCHAIFVLSFLCSLYHIKSTWQCRPHWIAGTGLVLRRSYCCMFLQSRFLLDT